MIVYCVLKNTEKVIRHFMKVKSHSKGLEIINLSSILH